MEERIYLVSEDDRDEIDLQMSVIQFQARKLVVFQESWDRYGYDKAGDPVQLMDDVEKCLKLALNSISDILDKSGRRVQSPLLESISGVLQ